MRPDSFFRSLWAKRESASAHFAWGIALELALHLRGISAETSFVAVIAVAALWELGGELVTRRPTGGSAWTTRALDVPPWILGAGVAWVYLTL